MSQKPGRMAVLARAATGLQVDSWWHPAADVYRTRDGWIIKFELAGVEPEDCAVSAEGSTITVCGVRRDCLLEEDCRLHSLEISYNRFERAIGLPCDVEGASISTNWRHGILLVRVAPPQSSDERS
jgi:HSP20 family protein